MSPRDARLLERALAEAAGAEWLFTAPNPRVGALALLEGHLVGRGRHARHGGPHAEEAALRDAGAWDESSGGPVPGRVDEVVASLEPCFGEGDGKKRPPCVALLKAAGVQRVVAGASDPDPRNRGRGLEALRAAGIEVVMPEGFGEGFQAQNQAFLRALEHPGRPWVLLKWAATFDGKTAAEGGASQWITGPVAREEAHALRAASDAVLAGPRTLAADDPALTARPEGVALERQPLRVLLCPQGQPPEDARLFQAPGPRLWLLPEDAEPSAGLRRRVEAGEDALLPLPRESNGKLDLTAALERLRRDFGVRRLMVEGGARLHGALLDRGLADAVVRYEAPLLLGGTHGALLGRGFPAPEHGPRLGEEERRELGADLRRAFQVLAR